MEAFEHAIGADCCSGLFCHNPLERCSTGIGWERCKEMPLNSPQPAQTIDGQDGDAGQRLGSNRTCPTPISSAIPFPIPIVYSVSIQRVQEMSLKRTIYPSGRNVITSDAQRGEYSCSWLHLPICVDSALARRSVRALRHTDRTAIQTSI